MTPFGSRAHAALVVVGGAALLLAMGIDGVAVIGRHVDVPLLGSIEAVQAAVLVAGAVALLVSTLADRHARVHLLVDRLSPAARLGLQRAGFLLGAAVFATLAVASGWIASELWNGFEQSEWLRIPYAPLRVITVLSSSAVSIAFAVAAFRRGAP